MTVTPVIEGVCQVSKTRGSKPLNIAYQLHGNGDKHVLFINGKGGNLAFFIPQAKSLAMKGYQVCIFDNRGIGQSEKVEEEFTMMDMTIDTVELLDHLGWTSNVHLTGISMGGMVSLQLLAHYPQYFASGCLISTSANVNAEHNKHVLQAQMTQTDSDDVDAHLKVLFPEHWLSAPSTLRPGKLNRDVAIELLEHESDQDPNIIKWQTKAVRAHLITEEQLATICNSKIPVLVCTGDEDALVVPANSEYIAKMLQSPLKVFKGCGHLIEVQEPEEYSRMITEHIDKASNHHNASVTNE